jgi:pumilio homology domain family member 6
LLHREASRVLADSFELYANSYERTLLLRDFYGKEIALFSLTLGSEQDKELAKKGLRGAIEGVDNERKKRVLNAVKENLVAMCVSIGMLPKWIFIGPPDLTTPTRAL